MSKILLGISGGIAAYKSASLVRLLVKDGHEVKVMMTSDAEKFIGALTLEALSSNQVMTNGSAPSAIGHIDYASWADYCIVAPATANIIAKMASGIADEIVSTTLLAVSCPIIIAPAMNTNMYENPATMANILKLKSWGRYIVEPADGELACGVTGKGRMAEPEEIVEFLSNLENKLPVPIANEDVADYANDMVSEFNNLSIEEYFDGSVADEEVLDGLADNADKGILTGVKILVTAGATREYIDPVRYITNKSSGKMGYAIAEQAKQMGADVLLVSGVTEVNAPDVDIVSVETAESMFNAVTKHAKNYDIIIMSAAVADYTPANVSDVKIKKSDDDMTLSLVKTQDILKSVGENKRAGQVVVGFAAETNDVELNALKKLDAKNADIIVANDVSRTDIGFSSDDNDVTLYFRDGSQAESGKCSKQHIAKIILTESAILLKNNEN